MKWKIFGTLKKARVRVRARPEEKECDCDDPEVEYCKNKIYDEEISLCDCPCHDE